MSARADASSRPDLQERPPRSISAVVWTLVAAFVLLIPVGAVCQIVLTSQLDDRSRTQAIVVMDPARYWGDDDPVRAARLEHAAALYREGAAPVVILTGSKRTVEGSKARLVLLGVPARDVVAFPSGTDTLGSLRVVGTVLRDLGWQSATIVTDPAQAARTQATASGYGIDAHVSPTQTGPGQALTSEYVGRETAALLRYYLLSRWAQPQLVPSVD